MKKCAMCQFQKLLKPRTEENKTKQNAQKFFVIKKQFQFRVRTPTSKFLRSKKRHSTYI